MAQQTPHPNSLLKDTREAKGLTLEIVHEATKIPMDALKAIEQGYSVRILTPFYYRGFVKIYAEFLGLDPVEVFKAHNMEKSPAPATVVVKTKKSKAAKPNPAFEQAQEFLGSLWTAKNRKRLLRLVGVLIAVFVLFKFAGCVVGHFKAKPKSAVMAVKAKEVKAKPIEEKSQTVDEAVPAQTLKAQNGKVELAVRALKNSWIQVKADGKVVFAMTMQKGTMEQWSAKDKIELSGHNINELDLEVNGKHLGSLGSSERRARRAIITKEGLTVKK